MGWTSTNRHGKSVREFLDGEFHFDPNYENRWKIIDHSIVNRTVFYGVGEFEAGPKQGKRFAIVVLLKHAPRSHYNISYKEMDESCGPVENNCPARILDQLSPAEDLFAGDSLKWATAWRDRCRENIAKQTAAAKIKKGVTVVFADAIEFTNGVKASRFTLIERSTFYLAGTLARYRISNWRSREYTVAEG